MGGELANAGVFAGADAVLDPGEDAAAAAAASWASLVVEECPAGTPRQRCQRHMARTLHGPRAHGRRPAVTEPTTAR